MKKLIIYIFTVFPFFVSAQEQRWEMIYGSPGWDEYPEAIFEQYDGGIGITAYTESNSSTIWNIKTNKNGELLYDKDFIHNSFGASADAIATDDNGNTYIGGTFFPGGGDFLPYVIKIDSCGDLLWCRDFPFAPNSFGGFTGDIILNQNNELVILMSYSTGDQDDQIYLACIDSDGNQLWFSSYARKRDYPLLVDPIGRDLVIHNNEYFIGGYCYYPYPGNPNHVYLRPLFIGIDSTFREKFMTPFYALDSIFGETLSIKPLNDSTMIGVGYRYADGEDKNSIIMLINTEGIEKGLGQINNSSIFPNLDFNIIQNIHQINENEFLSPVYLGIDGIERYGEIVYNINGNILNASNRGEYKSNYTSLKSTDSSFIVSLAITDALGAEDILLYKIDQNLNPVPFDTTQHVYDSLCPHTIQSGEIDLTDCLVVTSIKEWPTPDEYYESIRWIPIKVYPNPVTEGKLTLEFENTDHHSKMELRCFDDFGRQIHSQKIYKGQQETIVNVSGWPPGIYIAVVYSDGSARGKAKFVVR